MTSSPPTLSRRDCRTGTLTLPKGFCSTEACNSCCNFCCSAVCRLISAARSVWARSRSRFLLLAASCSRTCSMMCMMPRVPVDVTVSGVRMMSTDACPACCSLQSIGAASCHDSRSGTQRLRDWASETRSACVSSQDRYCCTTARAAASPCVRCSSASRNSNRVPREWSLLAVGCTMSVALRRKQAKLALDVYRMRRSCSFCGNISIGAALWTQA